jgi:YVTN family beta-propeller protein
MKILNFKIILTLLISSIITTNLLSHLNAQTGNVPHAFDLGEFYVKDTIPMDMATELAISPDGEYLLIVQTDPGGVNGKLTLLNTTNYVTETITIGSGFPIGAVFSANNLDVLTAVSRRYGGTTVTGPNRVILVDVTSATIDDTILTSNSNPLGPSYVVVSPNNQFAYVSERGPSQVLVLDLNTGTVIQAIPVGLGPLGISITHNGARVYTANREGNSVSAIDVTTNTQIGLIPLTLNLSNISTSIAISPSDEQAYVVNTSSSEIAVVDINPSSTTYHQQIGEIYTSGSILTKIVISPDGTHALVTSAGTDELLIIDTEVGSPTYHTQVDSLHVGDEPWSIVYQNNLNSDAIAYVANRAGDQIAVIASETAITNLSAINDSPTSIGSSTYFTATISTGENAQYLWAFGDGSYGTGETTTHIYPALGTYTAIVTATNQVSQMTATTTVEVVDIPIAGLTASNSSPTIVGNQTFLAAATSSGTNIQYTWAFGDGSYGNGANPTHTYPAVGNYTAIVTATNTNNTLSASTQVQVIDVAVSGLAAANDSPTILGNNTHLFATVSGGTNIQYTWAFGDGTYGSGASPSHVYPTVGNYMAIVTATNSNNSQSASTLVTIESGISYTYLPMVSFCEATPIWADIALVIDTSGSMASPTEPGGVSKLAAAQTAAATLLTFLDLANQRDQAALVAFDNIATLEHPLSRNEATLLTAINNLQLGNLTRMDLGLQIARLELTGVRHDLDNQTAIIFLTDGQPNGTTEAEVLAQAALAKQAGIVIYTVGLGSDVNSSLLQAVASAPAYYYPSPSTDDLNAIYQQIASSLACR